MLPVRLPCCLPYLTLQAFQRGFQRSRATVVADDCAALGLPPPPPLPTLRAVRRAYRRVAQRTHPDRLPPDATADARRAAIEAFRDTHTSYERLLAALGGGGGGGHGGGEEEEEEEKE